MKSHYEVLCVNCGEKFWRHNRQNPEFKNKYKRKIGSRHLFEQLVEVKQAFFVGFFLLLQRLDIDFQKVHFLGRSAVAFRPMGVVSKGKFSDEHDAFVIGDDYKFCSINAMPADIAAAL